MCKTTGLNSTPHYFQYHCIVIVIIVICCRSVEPVRCIAPKGNCFGGTLPQLPRQSVWHAHWAAFLVCGGSVNRTDLVWKSSENEVMVSHILNQRRGYGCFHCFVPLLLWPDWKILPFPEGSPGAYFCYMVRLVSCHACQARWQCLNFGLLVPMLWITTLYFPETLITPFRELAYVAILFWLGCHHDFCPSWDLITDIAWIISEQQKVFEVWLRLAGIVPVIVLMRISQGWQNWLTTDLVCKWEDWRNMSVSFDTLKLSSKSIMESHCAEFLLTHQLQTDSCNSSFHSLWIWKFLKFVIHRFDIVSRIDLIRDSNWWH